VKDGQRCKLFAPAVEKWVVSDQQRTNAVSDHRFKDRIELGFSTRVYNFQILPERMARCM
jgi:hypothetical protein